MASSWWLYIRDRDAGTWHAIWRASGPRAEAATRARFDQIATTFAGGAGGVYVGASWAAVRLVVDDLAVAECERAHWHSAESTRPTARPPRSVREG